MSILKEIDYSEYVSKLINLENTKFIKDNIDEYNYLREELNPLDYAVFLPTDKALEIINMLYDKNIFYLKKEPWAVLLIERIRKDVKKGFCKVMKIEPSLFIKFMRMIRPILSLFSKAHIFTQTLNDLDMFYNTAIGGCYIPNINKMYITYRYIDKTMFDLDTFKILLHEYCHYYSYRKHKEYVELFKDMCLTFYTSIVENICGRTDINFDKQTKIKLIATILDGVFNYRINNKKLQTMMSKLYDINETFATIYYRLILARKNFIVNDAYYSIAHEVLVKAYKDIGNTQISEHVSKFDFAYQEFYCSDEVVAIMSYYKPNSKPYLEMLRRL